MLACVNLIHRLFVFFEGLQEEAKEYQVYVKQVAALEFECGRQGGEPSVADFVCEECGKEGVSISEEFLPIGKCCYCGYENEVHICEMCGIVYDDYGGSKGICNSCMPRED